MRRNVEIEAGDRFRQDAEKSHREKEDILLPSIEDLLHDIGEFLFNLICRFKQYFCLHIFNCSLDIFGNDLNVGLLLE